MSELPSGMTPVELGRALLEAGLPVRGLFVDNFTESTLSAALISLVGLPEILIDSIMAGRDADNQRILPQLCLQPLGSLLLAGAEADPVDWERVEGMGIAARFGLGHAAGMRVLTAGEDHSYLVMFRDRDQGPWTEEERVFVESLYPSIREAFLKTALPLMPEFRMLWQLCSEEGQGLCFCDPSGRVWAQNQTSHLLFRAFHRELRSSFGAAELAGFWPAWGDESSILSSASLCCGKREAIGNSRLRLVRHRLSAERYGLREDAYMVVMSVQDCPGETAEMKLPFERYSGLNARERKVAELLCRGFQIEEMAARHGWSASSIRAMIPKVYRALGVKTKYELARLISGHSSYPPVP